MPRYKVTQDGEVEVHDDGEESHVACCDCGLVHTYNYGILDDKIVLKVRRDNRRTAGTRRGMYKRKEGIFKKGYPLSNNPYFQEDK